MVSTRHDLLSKSSKKCEQKYMKAATDMQQVRSVLRVVRLKREESSSIFLENVVFYLILDIWVRFNPQA